MSQVNDININISKDKIRTGVIFLSGFIIGEVIFAITLKEKLKKRLEVQSLKIIEQVCDDSTKSVDRITNAMDKLMKQTKKLEDAINISATNQDDSNRIGFQVLNN